MVEKSAIFGYLNGLFLYF